MRGARRPVSGLPVARLVPWAPWAPWLAAALAGCGEPAAGGPDPLAREADSAGVTLVVSPDTAPVWEVGEPSMSVGGTAGASDDPLYRVRDARLLPDGRLAVVNAGASELRIYGGDGALADRRGRAGDGPGEFRNPSWVRPYRGDSLVVWDDRLRRLTILPDDGGRPRTLGLAAPGSGEAAPPRAAGPAIRSAGGAGIPVAYGVFPDGGFLGRVGEVSVGPGDTTAVRRDRYRYHRFDPDGRPVAEVAALPDDEVFVWAEGGSRSARPRAFGRTTAVVTVGERVAVADNRAFQVVVLGTDGETEAVYRVDVPARPVTDEQRERWTVEEVEGLGDGLMRRLSEPAVRAMRFPDSLPAHGGLLAAPGGSLWLERYRLPWDGGGATWMVLGPDGLRARVALPPRHRLTQVTESALVAVARDTLDVERVVVLPLRRRR